MSRERTPSSYSYRGKRPDHRPHSKAWLIVLLCLLAVGLILFGIARYLQRYMVYSRDGAYMLLPGEAAEEDTSRELSPVDDLTVQEEYAVPAVSREDPADLWAIEVTADELISGSISRQAQDCSANAVVVEMKGSDGVLLWNTAMQTLSYTAVTGTDEDGLDITADFSAAVTVDPRADALRDALAQCRSDGLYLIARISVLHDESLAAAAGFGGETAGWVDPSLTILQDYYSILAKELNQLGFDELVLTDLTAYDPVPAGTANALSQLIPVLCGDATQNANGTPMRIGLALPGSALQQEYVQDVSVSALSALYDRLWVGSISADTAAAEFSSEQLENGSVVLSTKTFSPDLSSCALLMEADGAN